MPSFSAPAWYVTVGDLVLTRLHQFEVVSSRLAAFDTATLLIPKGILPAPAPGAALTISQGYRTSGLWPIFEGTVRRCEPWGDQLCIRGWDRMGPIVTRTVSRAFTGAVPQEILRWLCDQAGVTQYHLTSRRYVPLPRFVAQGTIGQVLSDINQAWGLRNDCYWLPEVGLWWGPPDESPRAETEHLISYGENMLDHVVEAGGRRGRLVTEPMPIYHSNMVVIRDPRAWTSQRRLRVDRVVYQARPARVVVEWSDPELN